MAKKTQSRKDEVLLIIREHPGHDAVELRNFGLLKSDAAILLEMELEGLVKFKQDPVTHRWGWHYNILTVKASDG